MKFSKSLKLTFCKKNKNREGNYVAFTNESRFYLHCKERVKLSRWKVEFRDSLQSLNSSFLSVPDVFY